MLKMNKITTLVGALSVVACNTAADPSSQQTPAAVPEFLVKVDGQAFATQAPSLDVAFYSDDRVVLQPVGFSVGEGAASTGVIFNPRYEFLETGRFTTHIKAGPTDRAGATLYLDREATPGGSMTVSLERTGNGRLVHLEGSVDGVVMIEFSGPANVTCLVPRDAIDDPSIPAPPVAVGEAAEEVLISDDEFASPQCKSLLKMLTREQ